MEELLTFTWGEKELNQFTVLDPFAGGGSIPFEARRYGFATIANELNPVPYATAAQLREDEPVEVVPLRVHIAEC